MPAGRTPLVRGRVKWDAERICTAVVAPAPLLITINIMGRSYQDEAEKAFGTRLSALLAEGRKGKGRSVRDVAAAIGASRHGLYAVEKGRVHSPGFRTVYLLAREYELDLTELAQQAADSPK